MATHSSVLAWRIPGTVEPGGSHRIRHDWNDLAAAADFALRNTLQISTDYSLEGLMLKLKLQYFGHLIRRTDSLEKTLMLGKIEGRREGDNRGWDGWMASLTQWTWVWARSGSQWWTGRPGMLQSMGPQRVGHDWMTELNRPLLEDKTDILRFSSTPRSYSPGHLLVDQESNH